MTTIAGSVEGRCIDGIGLAAAFNRPVGIYYMESNDSLLIAEASSHRIRCLFPVTDKRKSALVRALTFALIETNAIPIHALLSIVYDYAAINSTFSVRGGVPFVALPNLLSRLNYAVPCEQMK